MKMPTDAIREEILKKGAISFARFMELALYCPETGYYETEKGQSWPRRRLHHQRQRGQICSANCSPSSSPNGWKIEVKAGSQKSESSRPARMMANWQRIFWLAAKIHGQNFLPKLNTSSSNLLRVGRNGSKNTLKSFARRVNGSPISKTFNLKLKISNCAECFSPTNCSTPFPSIRYGWDAKEKMVRVGRRARRRKIHLDKNATTGFAIGHLPDCHRRFCQSYPTITPSKFLPLPKTGGAPPPEFWQLANCWRLITASHADEQFSPARLNGTLRAYHRHHVSDDLLAHPGEQDLTAHVNFPAIQKAGEEAGLKTELFCTQPQFITHILQKAVTKKAFASLDAKQVRQFQTLTHPEHLGRAFRVLVQSRG
jgi:hypothetical protein